MKYTEDFESEIGDLPNYANPERIQKIRGHSTSRYGVNPEKAAAAQYRDVLAKVQQFTGQTTINPMALSFKAMQDLQNVIDTETKHKEYFEELAVETVLDMAEFYFIRNLIEEGELKIDAQLVKMGELNITQELDQMENELGDELDSLEPDDATEENSFSLAEILFDDDEKKARRVLANTISQGASLDAQNVYNLLGDELSEISPTLMQQYGFLLSFSTLMYYILPPGMEQMAQAGQAGQVNVEEVNGVYTIKARAVIFPILIQEIVKGVYQYISLTSGLEGAEEGGIEAETDDIIVGREVSRAFRRLVDPKDVKYIVPAIQHMYINLETDEIKKIFTSPNAKAIVKDIIDFFKAEEESQQ